MPDEQTPPGFSIYTLGQSINALEGSERAYEANLRTAHTTIFSGGAAVWWSAQASALKFTPDPARMPGIDRLEALCDEEWGSGLTAESVRKLRGRLCKQFGIGTVQADSFTLQAVADALTLKPGNETAKQAQPVPPEVPVMSPEQDPVPPETAPTIPCPNCKAESLHIGEGVYYCRKCRELNDTQPWDNGKKIIPVSSSDLDAIPVEIVRVHAPIRFTSSAEQSPATDRRPRPPNVPVELFYSYSHKDEKLRDKLETHLSQLKRDRLIAGWHDRKISAGTEWKGQIDKHLNSARIILLLVSADFIASDYCSDVEMKQAMQRHEAGEARVIPIILKPCDWHTAPFGKLQALPRNALPVTKWTNRDEALTDAARGIPAAIAELTAGQ